MISVSEVLTALDQIAPSRLAYSWDRIGLLLGDATATVNGIVFSLDATSEAVELCKETQSNLLITHHPAIWEPLATIRSSSVVYELIQNGIHHIAAHTNWDAAPGGVSDTLAEVLGLSDIHAPAPGPVLDERKIVVFVPVDSLEVVREAAFSAGAGIIGAYSHCSFFTEGTGTFLGSAQSNPALGKKENFEQAKELRLELICPGTKVQEVLSAIHETHPYETPAVDVYDTFDHSHPGMLRVGSLPSKLNLNSFAEWVDERLSAVCVAYGDPRQLITRVAVAGGAAGSDWRAALSAGANVFVTGEAKHNEILDATQAGLHMVVAGHYCTEQPAMHSLHRRMSSKLPDLAMTTQDAQPGRAGRPRTS